jgi:hypothetical protein
MLDTLFLVMLESWLLLVTLLLCSAGVFLGLLEALAKVFVFGWLLQATGTCVWCICGDAEKSRLYLAWF